MPNPDPASGNAALLPDPALFDVTNIAQQTVEGRLERVALEHLTLAPNPRRQLSTEGIQRLAGLLMRTGQLIPCIGRRPHPDQRPVLLFDGQRRLLAAQASHQLAGTEGFEGLAPVAALIVLLLDHDPSGEEIRRIQAQANTTEALSLLDQQTQFSDCWQARATLHDDDRISAVCADLGISAKKAHNLRRQLTLPEPIRERVADRPAGAQLSVTMANRLADMHDIAPQLTDAVAGRITTTDLHDQALRDLGAFVHRTVVEDQHTYAVRIDDGALLDAADQLERARAQLTGDNARARAARLLGVDPDTLDTELDALTARARTRALKLRITGEIRDRARAGRFAYVHDSGPDYAAGIWIIDPLFILDLAHNQLTPDNEHPPAREHTFFAGAGLNDDELRQAAHDDQTRKQQARLHQAEAT